MKRTCLILPLLVVTLFAGCSSKNKPIAGEVEESMKTRWVAKRMGELQATGTEAREARRIAVEEFKQKFEYAPAAQKVDPLAGVNQ
jgi:hypothetical protein